MDREPTPAEARKRTYGAAALAALIGVVGVGGMGAFLGFDAMGSLIAGLVMGVLFGALLLGAAGRAGSFDGELPTTPRSIHGTGSGVLSNDDQQTSDQQTSDQDGAR